MNFLGLDDAFSSYANSNYVILPIPYERTVSYGRGTQYGPQAIVEASTQVELYDVMLDSEAYKAGIHTLPPLQINHLVPNDIKAPIANQINQLLTDQKYVCALGGEHSITPAIANAFESHYTDLTVVQFDAHADLRDSYEGEPMSHACAMARVRETLPAVQIGTRSLSIDEARKINQACWPVFFAHELDSDFHWIDRMIKSIQTENVFITFDVDAFCSSILPATGTPEPGGLSWHQVMKSLHAIFLNKNVVGMDIVELAPIQNYHAYDFMIAKLAYHTIGLHEKYNGY